MIISSGEYVMCVSKVVWKVQCKPNNDSQPWVVLQEHDNKGDALLHGLRISGDYFMVKVTDSDDALIWIS